MKKFNKDIGLLLSGGQVVIPEIGIFITQPTIKQICQFGEMDFLQGLQLLTKMDELIKDVQSGNKELAKLDSFQVLMIVLQNQPELEEIIVKFFALICPDYELKFSNNTIDFYIPEDPVVKGKLHSYNVQDFGEAVNEIFMPYQDDGNVGFNPADAAAERIAKKLQEARDRLKRKNSSSGDSSSIFGMYASVLSIGTGIDINTVFGYTPFQLYDSINRYWLKVQYDLYQRIATTPMMDVSKLDEPKHWAKNIYAPDDSPNSNDGWDELVYKKQ